MITPVKYIFIACSLLTGNKLFAQGVKDSVHQVQDVLIERSSVDKASSAADVIPATEQGRRLSETLNEYSGVYLKNYGPGQLSSISINGSSAAQTSILWNGIKLNSPTTGQVDLSLFDVNGDDNLSIYLGGHNSATNFVNGLGGTVALDNRLKLNNQTIRSSNLIRAGSFGLVTLSTSNTYGTAGFKGATKFAYIRADNEFPFVNDTKIGAPVVRETNAATKQLSFTQQLEYTFRKPFTIGANLWITDADRQLPPVMTTDVGSEREWDQSYRAMLYLTGSRSRFNFSFKSAYLYDKLRYTNPLATIDSRSSSKAIRNLFSGSYRINHGFTLDGVLNYDHESAVSTGFDVSRQRELLGLNLAAAYQHSSGFGVSLAARQELQDFHALPFAPSLTLKYAKRFANNHGISIALNGERNYRIPALNDLYWTEGGNPTLRPEKAWKSSFNVGYSYSYLLSLKLNTFYNYVTDWILWHPTSSGIWKPDNVRRVLSRGYTLNLVLRSSNDAGRKFVASGYVSYSYTQTISLDAVSANDNSKDKQLIYVPLHNVTATIELKYRHFYIRSMHSFTGVRYTSTDNSQSLPGYYLTHLEVGKNFFFSGQQIGLSFRINNISNSQYQMVTQRPMPGRSFEGTVRINLAR